MFTHEMEVASSMQVKDGMSNVVLTIGPGHTLREAARLMAERNVGAAIVVDPDTPGPGIITERDVLRSVAAGHDCEQELVSDHLTDDAIVASPEWSLQQAADSMIEGGFRHLLVVDGSELQGVLSMRDIVRCWAKNPSFP
jgi:CBS domain-containing protein